MRLRAVRLYGLLAALCWLLDVRSCGAYRCPSICRCSPDTFQCSRDSQLASRRTSSRSEPPLWVTPTLLLWMRPWTHRRPSAPLPLCSSFPLGHIISDFCLIKLLAVRFYDMICHKCNICSRMSWWCILLLLFIACKFGVYYFISGCYRRFRHLPLKQVPTHAFKELINITVM